MKLISSSLLLKETTTNINLAGLRRTPANVPFIAAFSYADKRVLMGAPNSQLTTNFSAKSYQLTTILGANSQLTTKRG